jgi:ABC-type transporter Mla subunit MlaD
MDDACAIIMHMHRVQIQFTAAQAEALRRQAAASDRSIAAVVREAVDAWTASDERRQRVDRALAAIGGFHSGLGDLAENHDRYLDEAVRT